MDAIPPDQRQAHLERTAGLIHAAADITSLDHGYRLTLGPEHVTEIAAFIENERKCCPFLEFTVRVGANADGIELVMTGPEGTREFLEVELLG